MSHHAYYVEAVMADRLREAALARRRAHARGARRSTVRRPRPRRRLRMRLA